MSSKSERRAARSVVADHHDAQLGELDAFDVDLVLFQYSRAAKEL